MSRRTELVSLIDEALGLEKGLGDKVLTDVVNSVKYQLSTKGEAVLPGLGRLKIVTKPARRGRNPRTGEPVDIPERLAVKFKLFPNIL